MAFGLVRSRRLDRVVRGVGRVELDALVQRPAAGVGRVLRRQRRVAGVALEAELVLERRDLLPRVGGGRARRAVRRRPRPGALDGARSGPAARRSGRPGSRPTRWGWWQSAHTACRLSTPANSSSTPETCAPRSSSPGGSTRSAVAGSLAGSAGSSQSDRTSLSAPVPSWQVKQVPDCGSGCWRSIGPCAVWAAWHSAHVSEASPPWMWGDVWPATGAATGPRRLNWAALAAAGPGRWTCRSGRSMGPGGSAGPDPSTGLPLRCPGDRSTAGLPPMTSSAGARAGDHVGPVDEPEGIALTPPASMVALTANSISV